MKNTEKLWGLEFRTFPKYARHYMDYNYIHKLSYKEKIWLSRFNEEWYGNRLTDETKADPSLRKHIYNQTNARNRDIYSKLRRFYSNDGAYYKHTEQFEDVLIDIIDFKLGNKEDISVPTGTKVQDVIIPFRPGLIGRIIEWFKRLIN